MFLSKQIRIYFYSMRSPYIFRLNWWPIQDSILWVSFCFRFHTVVNCMLFLCKSNNREKFSISMEIKFLFLFFSLSLFSLKWYYIMFFLRNFFPVCMPFLHFNFFYSLFFVLNGLETEKTQPECTISIVILDEWTLNSC